MGKVPDGAEHDRLSVVGRRRVFQLLGWAGIVGGVSTGIARNATQTIDGQASSNKRVVTTNLSESNFRLLSRLTELIIPKTDTAGAIEAGVPEFIDAALVTTSKAEFAAMSGSSSDYLGVGEEIFLDNLPVLFADGLHWIEDQSASSNGKGFMELEREKQVSLLQALYAPLESGNTVGRTAQFLRMLKSMTVEGYYTSREGLIEELGYKGNAPHVMPSVDGEV